MCEAAAADARSQEMRELAEIFVLSGGEPAILEPWADSLEPGSAEKRLFEGVMAYGQGRTSEAEAKLLSIDAMGLDPIRGGHLSLTQALLSGRLDAKRAFAHFETAAMLLPGTLVEEAALRQRAVLAAKTGDTAQFSSAAISYLRRFPRSAYIGGFETQIALFMPRFSDEAGSQVLAEILAAFPHGWGRCLDCFLITVAQQAILLGKVELTQASAAAALQRLPPDSPERQRLVLYSGSAAIVTDKFPKGLERLRSVREAQLSPEDRELLAASLALALKLRETPALLSQSNQEARSSSANGNRVFPASGRQEAAERVLAEAEAILRNAK
jgi:chemotaxis protein MotC